MEWSKSDVEVVMKTEIECSKPAKEAVNGPGVNCRALRDLVSRTGADCRDQNESPALMAILRRLALEVPGHEQRLPEIGVPVGHGGFRCAAAVKKYPPTNHR